ncbi:TIGR01777 family oxidoreductase [Corynebacterium choanae]|uniref:Epimerase family protein n=1 Tax=Corynebacterium choanae TaxID=1862358 RepID=A0A3G6J762_9CORY|nr:TIGR01777 family oxidoreductase [Corynebacterium choanae]AZA13662.1 Epimerase family protein [Corynebacterium choanae]
MSLTTSHIVDAPREDVWLWHTRPGAMARLTPPFAPLKPKQQASSLRDGTSVFTLPGGVEWVAQHQPDGFVDGAQFVDEVTTTGLSFMTRWRHTHEFTAAGETTLITDSVATRIPGPMIRPVFAYRQRQLQLDVAFARRLQGLASHQFPDAAAPTAHPLQPRRPLTVAITGASGLVGRAVASQLATLGHRVITLTRQPAADKNSRTWDPQYPHASLLDGVDALIHLAGEPIVGRFTEEHKQQLYASRVGPTRKLATLVANSSTCRVMVCASAIGIYGADRGETLLGEDAAHGDDFLATVCHDWEHATAPVAAADNHRIVNMRTGMVLAGDGGLLPLLETVVKTGVGGKLGDGNQWFSWIALDDLADLYVRAVCDANIHGPVNAVAPNPVRNETFMHTLGQVLRRPTVIPTPKWAPALLLGQQGAEELALANQHVTSTVLGHSEHTFRYCQLAAALRHELGRERLVAGS